MFVEPQYSNVSLKKLGWIEIICGSMFSGKTEELIRRVKRALIARQLVMVFKPMMDVRYSKKKVVSHDESQIHSSIVNTAKEMLLQVDNAEVIGIDEAQFFESSIVEVATTLAVRGKRVIIAGLDMDFEGNPFSPMDSLMAVAEYITKVHAICVKCGNVASYSHRRVRSKKKILLGEKDIYEALCRNCFFEDHHPSY